MKRPSTAGMILLAVLVGACSSGGSVHTSAASTTVPALTTMSAPSTPPAGSTVGSTPGSTVGSTSGSTSGPGAGSTHPTGAATTMPAPARPSPPPTAPTQTTQVGARPVSATATSGGLTVTLTASSARAARGTPVQFTVSATETHAQGALGYRIAYGDGATDQNAVPQFCVAGPGSPQTQNWQLTHAYTTSGTFTVSVTVTANCTPDHATATLAVTVV